MKDKVKIAVIFDGVSKYGDNVSRIHYHLDSQTNLGEKTFSASAIVGDDNLLKKLSKLSAGTKIIIEKETDWEEKNLSSYLVGFQNSSEPASAESAKNGKAPRKAVLTGKAS